MVTCCHIPAPPQPYKLKSQRAWEVPGIKAIQKPERLHALYSVLYGTSMQLLLYVDLHGHSRKHNVFMYGCHVPHCNHLQLLQERVLPFLMSQQVVCCPTLPSILPTHLHRHQKCLISGVASSVCKGAKKPQEEWLLGRWVCQILLQWNLHFMVLRMQTPSN